MKIKQLLLKNYSFRYVNENITDENFPYVKREHGDYKIFSFNKYILSEEVIKEMDKEGYIPCTIHELLEWEEWNGIDFVVALGSVCELDGYRHVAYLCGISDHRGLGMGYLDGDWIGSYQFAGVRKSKLNTNTLETSTLSNLVLWLPL